MKGPGWRVALWVMVGFKLLAHLVSQVVTPYEVHRDEFLYVAMGSHLRLWHMDFPPFIAVAANIQRFLFGDVLWGLRVLPALAGACLIWITMDVTRRLGGRVTAQVIAGGIVLLSPLVLRTSVLFQPVVFDQLWWSLALWALLRRGLDDDPRWWIGVGVALGMGLFTKFSIAFLALPLAAATLLTPLRKDLVTRWPWAGAAMALLLGHPSLAGQVALRWPFFTQMQDLQAEQLSQVTVPDFLLEQVLLTGPGVLLAVVGATWLVAARGRPAHRTAGLAALGAFGLLLLLHGKAYYAGPVFPVLLGAGGAAISTVRTWVSRFTLTGVAVAQLAFGAVALPLGLPILAPEPMARYARWLGITGATETNRGEQLDLPQDYADMLGWEVFADTVIRVWRELDPEDRDRAVVFGTNYGRAGALDWYGRAAGLPPAVSNVGSYWFWGYGNPDWDVVIFAGGELEDLRRYFRDVVEVARVQDGWRVPEERDVAVFVARGPYQPIATLWPGFEGRN
ncbi:MAG TPA: glycosyltransferase family 39 protein [Longimicrobiales bacterium]|nr:glycosyltransferase family 39 protein [Longimicrobiales bacterium]